MKIRPTPDGGINFDDGVDRSDHAPGKVFI